MFSLSYKLQAYLTNAGWTAAEAEGPQKRQGPVDPALVGVEGGDPVSPWQPTRPRDPVFQGPAPSTTR
jgi:hypothetical protein